MPVEVTGNGGILPGPKHADSTRPPVEARKLKHVFLGLPPDSWMNKKPTAIAYKDELIFACGDGGHNDSSQMIAVHLVDAKDCNPNDSTYGFFSINTHATRINIGMKGPHNAAVIERKESGNAHEVVADALVELGVVEKKNIRFSNSMDDFGPQ